MKKIFVTVALVSLFVGGSKAQTGLQDSHFLDNWYTGIKTGVSMPMTLDEAFPLNPTVGIKLGKRFSPTVGANIEVLSTMGDNGLLTQTSEPFYVDSKTFVKGINIGVNGTFNWTNLVCGYYERKTFEVSSELGLGMTKFFGNKTNADNKELSAKTSMTLAWNFGGYYKPWQFYIEPGVYWNLTSKPNDAIQLNRRAAHPAFQIGVNYKFRTSNGTHDFKTLELYSLNEQINFLRKQLAAKPKEVVREVVREVPVEKHSVKTVRIANMYIVTFEKAKAVLSSESRKSLDKITKGSHVEITATASPEGKEDSNKRLSMQRAKTVADYLTQRGVVVDKVTGEGVQGATSNRIAVVYVK